jgi:hypothetical protein
MLVLWRFYKNKNNPTVVTPLGFILVAESFQVSFYWQTHSQHKYLLGQRWAEKLHFTDRYSTQTVCAASASKPILLRGGGAPEITLTSALLGSVFYIVSCFSVLVRYNQIRHLTVVSCCYMSWSQRSKFT